MALTGNDDREYLGDNVTIADFRQIVTDTTDWPADSPVHICFPHSDGQVKIVVEKASV